MHKLMQYLTTFVTPHEEDHKKLKQRAEEADQEFWDSIEDLDKTITRFKKSQTKLINGDGI